MHEALSAGVLAPVEFSTPVQEPAFYQGVKVRPGHVAAGLVLERHANRRFGRVSELGILPASTIYIEDWVATFNCEALHESVQNVHTDSYMVFLDPETD